VPATPNSPMSLAAASTMRAFVASPFLVTTGRP
jgi:hypothetical protein